MAVNAKYAVKRAIDYYRDITGDRAQFLIEEVELISDEIGRDVWQVTISIPDQFAFAVGARTIKNYKVLRILQKDGEVISMKIRELGS
jgi:hypothetical protein